VIDFEREPMGPGGDIDQQVSWSRAMLIILERPGTQGLSRRILTVFQRKRSSPRQGGSRGECGGYKIKFEKGGHVHRFEDNAITPSGNRRKISQLILSDLGLRF
jgi:hypothetical protein